MRSLILLVFTFLSAISFAASPAPKITAQEKCEGLIIIKSKDEKILVQQLSLIIIQNADGTYDTRAPDSSRLSRMTILSDTPHFTLSYEENDIKAKIMTVPMKDGDVQTSVRVLEITGTIFDAPFSGMGTLDCKNIY